MGVGSTALDLARWIWAGSPPDNPTRSASSARVAERAGLAPSHRRASPHGSLDGCPHGERVGQTRHHCRRPPVWWGLAVATPLLTRWIFRVGSGLHGADRPGSRVCS